MIIEDRLERCLVATLRAAYTAPVLWAPSQVSRGVGDPLITVEPIEDATNVHGFEVTTNEPTRALLTLAAVDEDSALTSGLQLTGATWVVDRALTGQTLTEARDALLAELVDDLPGLPPGVTATASGIDSIELVAEQPGQLWGLFPLGATSLVIDTEDRAPCRTVSSRSTQAIRVKAYASDRYPSGAANVMRAIEDFLDHLHGRAFARRFGVILSPIRSKIPLKAERGSGFQSVVAATLFATTTNYYARPTAVITSFRAPIMETT